jgi:Na+-driven multidrug efflux pump
VTDHQAHDLPKPSTPIDPVTAVNPEDPPVGAIALGEAEAELDAEGVIRSGKLAGKSMWSAIWILAIPVLIQQTMAAMLGLFDKLMAGNLPAEIVVAAIDGLGIAAYIGWFIGIAMAGLGIGGQAIIARSMGSGALHEAEHALGNSMTLSFLWGALVGLFMWFAAPPLGQICGLQAEAARYCTEYVRVLAISMPLCGIMMVGSMCLHGAGETARPSLIAVVINIVNIIASWILSGADVRVGQQEIVNAAGVVEMAPRILENPFSFDLHVIGIALGTALSYAVGALLTVWVLFLGVKDLKLNPSTLKLTGEMTRRLVAVGVPSFCEGISMWAVNLFVLQFIGQIGRMQAEAGGSAEGLQGSHIIAVQWEAISFLPGFAIGTAAGALAGQYLGAGSARMAMRAILVCTVIGAAIMGTVGCVFMFAGSALTTIISNQPVFLEHVPNILFICGTIQVFFAITMVVRQGLRGVGDTKWAFIITTVSSYAVRLPAAWYLGVHLGYGIEGIWVALCGELVVRSILFSWRLFHGGWKKLQV